MSGNTLYIGGTFNYAAARPVAFKAVIYQKGPTAGAYGYFISPTPTVAGATGQAGGVSLNAK